MEQSINKGALNAYQLKIIAIIGMTLQHSAIAIGYIMPLWLMFILQFAGGLTFPIMAYLLVEGYKYTKSKCKYILRILLVALISHVPHMLVFGSFGFNIMYTLALGLIILVLNDKIKSRFLFYTIFVIFSIISTALIFDWFVVGFIMILMIYKIKNKKRAIIASAVVAFIYYAIYSMFFIIAYNNLEYFPDEFAKTMNILGYDFILTMSVFGIGCLLTIPLLFKYNGRRGRSAKFLFYAFYPLHLIILVILAVLLGINNFDMWFSLYFI